MISAVGSSISFAYWMQSHSAGWFLFFLLNFLDVWADWLMHIYLCKPDDFTGDGEQ